MTSIAELPRYKCHKVVQAGLIVSIFGGRLRVGTAPIDNQPYDLATMQGVVEIDVPDDWQREKRPAPGKVLVVYDDGYMSVSPLEPFLMGYTIEEASDAAPPA